MTRRDPYRKANTGRGRRPAAEVATAPPVPTIPLTLLDPTEEPQHDHHTHRR